MTERQLNALLELIANKEELLRIDLGETDTTGYHVRYIPGLRDSIDTLKAIVLEDS